jgi:hypothetical protein
MQIWTGRVELVKALKCMFMDDSIHCVFRIYSFASPITPNEENHSSKYHQNVQGFSLHALAR